MLILTVLSFFYIPSESADLYRIRTMSEGWQDYSFVEFCEKELLGSSYPLGILIYYVFSFLPKGFLPAFCCLVFSYFSFGVLKDLIRKDYSKKSIAVSFMFIMSTGAFLEAISDVRCFVSFSILMYIGYKIISNRKFRIIDIIGILIGCLIHTAAIVVAIAIIGFYIFFLKTNKATKAHKYMLLILVIVAAIFAIGIIESVLDKATSYLTNTIYVYSWEYIIGFVVLLLSIYVFVSYRKVKKKQTLSLEQANIFRFTFLFLLIPIIFCFEYNIFHRFITASMLVTAASIVYISNLTKGTKFESKFNKRIFYISLLILLIACVRGNLCGFKFFEISW